MTVDQPLPPEWRDYMLVKMTGWTKEQIDAQPAAWLDWMLTIDDVVTEVQNRQRREAAGT
jgi:hypothetical protein